VVASLRQATAVHFLSTGIRNAAWLLCGYWVAAIAAELISKFWPSPRAMMAIRVLEHFPEKVLQISGFLAPLREAMQGGVVSIVQVRLVYGAAALVGFVALSMLTGLCLWLLQRILRYWASRYEA
jgi:hypothetical protein